MVINVLAICGSVRHGSYNHLLMKEAIKLAPGNLHFEEFDLSKLPRFDPNLEASSVKECEDFLAKVAFCDAIMIVTPEYNASIPGYLKDAFDWASRPPHRPILGKIAVVMGASTGHFVATARAQSHVRQIGASLDFLMISKPEVLLADASSKFDSNGLTDLGTIARLKELLSKLESLCNTSKALKQIELVDVRLPA